MPDTIPPALTPSEWARVPEHAAHDGLETAIAVAVRAKRFDAVIAIANAAFPDDDPRKITQDTLFCLEEVLANFEAFASTQGDFGKTIVGQYSPAVRKLVDMIASYLPPRENVDTFSIRLKEQSAGMRYTEDESAEEALARVGIIAPGAKFSKPDPRGIVERIGLDRPPNLTGEIEVECVTCGPGTLLKLSTDDVTRAGEGSSTTLTWTGVPCGTCERRYTVVIDAPMEEESRRFIGRTRMTEEIALPLDRIFIDPNGPATELEIILNHCGANPEFYGPDMSHEFSTANGQLVSVTTQRAFWKKEGDFWVARRRTDAGGQ